MTYKVVLIRHGESVWNQENRFTGWTDVDLSEKGIQEAKKAAKVLIQNGITFDISFTSFLKRAIKTLNIIQEEMDLLWIPVKKSWRLNERHYGALQGLNKAETIKEYGEEQVHIWRRSYDITPPLLEKTDPRYAGNEEKYKTLDESEIPLTESLKTTVDRFLPYWLNEIVPEIKSGKKVVITAHGNTIRALIKYLDNVSENDITQLNIPTGTPFVYELDENLKPIKSYYLNESVI